MRWWCLSQVCQYHLSEACFQFIGALLVVVFGGCGGKLHTPLNKLVLLYIYVYFFCMQSQPQQIASTDVTLQLN